MNLFISLIINFLLCWFLTRFLIKPLIKTIPDIPNKRSAHKIIKPRGGGIAFILSNLITSNFFNQINFLFLLPLSITGLLDDFFNLNKWIRLLIQLSTTFYIFYRSNYFNLIESTNNYAIEIFLIILITFIGAGIINFCNFMDGIDGILCGSIITISIFASFFLSNSLYGIIGSLIGFLFWNWQPSKIFMGDVGSNFLGGVIIWIILNTNNLNISLGLLFIASPILIDPFICLFRRFIDGQNIFQAHNMHLYQRLNKRGFSHSKISLIYILSIIFIGISFLIGGLKLEIISFFFVLLIGYWLDNYYAAPFKKAS